MLECVPNSTAWKLETILNTLSRVSRLLQIAICKFQRAQSRLDLMERPCRVPLLGRLGCSSRILKRRGSMYMTARIDNVCNSNQCLALERGCSKFATMVSAADIVAETSRTWHAGSRKQSRIMLGTPLHRLLARTMPRPQRDVMT